MIPVTSRQAKSSVTKLSGASRHLSPPPQPQIAAAGNILAEATMLKGRRQQRAADEESAAVEERSAGRERGEGELS
jgi:hypothetical protein